MKPLPIEPQQQLGAGADAATGGVFSPSSPTDAPMTDQYIAWNSFQRRQVSMAPHFDFETVFLPVERRVGKLRKLLTYLRHGWRTLAILRQAHARVAWVQLPQVPLMWVALLYRRFFNRRAVVIADCHNAMFRPPWSKVPFGLSLLKRCDIVLVHNSDVLETAVQLGVERHCMLVVEDPPASFPTVRRFTGANNLPRPWFVFPASFAADEPIAELIEAARVCPDVSVLITGNVRNCREPALIASAPANVRFLGFLSREDFEALIVDCDAVIAFTRYDGIQLSVCGEALGAGKPMLASDTETLRRLFPKGTEFVNCEDPASIVRGMKDLLQSKEALTRAVRESCAEIADRWNRTRAEPLRRKLNAPAAKPEMA